MSTDFTLELRGNYIHVQLPPGYEITPEGTAAQFAAVGEARAKYGCRRVLVEGEAPKRRMDTTDAFRSGERAARAETGLSIAFCYAGYEPDELTAFFKNVAHNRGVRVEFFSDRAQALRWLGVDPAGQTAD